MDFDFEGRVLVVANRLPITMEPQGDGSYKYNMSSGGLVSGLRSLSKAIDFKWFGWCGHEVHRNDKDTVRRDLQNQFNAFPVFLDSRMAENHYNGFSNSVLWPLLHRMPDRAWSSEEDWSSAYEAVNEAFADNIIPYVEDGDAIWVHDYHLFLLPGILRKRLDHRKRKEIRIGFFLHTPFPSQDYFRILPIGEAICESLFNADVVGFHINEYARSFIDSAESVLKGVERSPSDLHYNGRKVIVHGFPIGIEPAEFSQKTESEEVQKSIEHIRAEFKGKKILIGVDRLDYIKGIPQKLKAFDRFLTENPEWIGKVVLIQLAIPSRSDVETYIKLRDEVELLVGNINGKHATFPNTPIHYLYKSVPPELLCALYAMADACLISSIRDGLNMVSYEYVACQQQRKGVLVLSQYTGAAQTLPSAVRINPWDTPRFCETIKRVLDMSMEERTQRQDAAMKVVQTKTSLSWGKAFLKTLIKMEVPKEECDVPDETPEGNA